MLDAHGSGIANRYFTYYDRSPMGALCPAVTAHAHYTRQEGANGRFARFIINTALYGAIGTPASARIGDIPV